MRIIVLSDTHVPVCSNTLPSKIYDYITGSDLIIHAGDIVEKSFLDELKTLKEVKAVCGNMDSQELSKCLPKKLTFVAGNKKIGITHGYGCKGDVLKNVMGTFKEKLDIIIFGHTHTVINKKIDGTIYFNPGSATDIATSNKCSFGVIDIDDDKIKTEIIEC